VLSWTVNYSTGIKSCKSLLVTSVSVVLRSFFIFCCFALSVANIYLMIPYIRTKFWILLIIYLSKRLAMSDRQNWDLLVRMSFFTLVWLYQSTREFVVWISYYLISSSFVCVNNFVWAYFSFSRSGSLTHFNNNAGCICNWFTL